MPRFARACSSTSKTNVPATADEPAADEEGTRQPFRDAKMGIVFDLPLVGQLQYIALNLYIERRIINDERTQYAIEWCHERDTM